MYVPLNLDRSLVLSIKFCLSTDPPRVISLTVDGEEVIDDKHLVNEDQKVNITCLFDKGNPPATFRRRLLDENNKEVDVSLQQRQLVHIFATPRCKQKWPVFRCEGQGSTVNKSVSFLLRCE